MEFSFDKHISEFPLFHSAPDLDLFAITQLNAAAFANQQQQPQQQLAEAVAEASLTPGKQKKTKKRRSVDATGKPYPLIKCPECPKTYRDNNAGKRHLQLHLTTHDPEAKAKFTCDKCSKTFSNEVYLKRHLNLCGAQKKRRNSISSSTCDDSSSETFVHGKPEEPTHEDDRTENLINFNAF